MVSEWVWWLIPIGVYWPLASLFLGGSPLEFRGGGAIQQLLGLILSFALYMAVWFGVRAGLGAVVGAVVGSVVATLLGIALIPVLSRVGFRIVGVKIVGPTFRGRAGEHGAHA